VTAVELALLVALAGLGLIGVISQLMARRALGNRPWPLKILVGVTMSTTITMVILLVAGVYPGAVP
jgi:hypothetical protein